MSQNVTIAGASYSDVPSITVPKTGGGSSSFTDVTDVTATASDVASGKYFYTASGIRTVGTGTGGSTLITKTITENGTYNASSDSADGYSSVTAAVPNSFSVTDESNTTGTTAVITQSVGGSVSVTQHTIHLEFTDSTDEDIDVYYDDSYISGIITSYIPETYGIKTVDSAALDNVIWYQRPSETWETIWDGNINFFPNTPDPYNYCWLSDLGSVAIPVGSVWRVTYENVEYRLTGYTWNGAGTIGNPKWWPGDDDGSGIPFIFTNNWGAWVGGTDAHADYATLYFKIERLVTE